MDHTKRILVIKLQAYNNLSSSNMRMLAMMKGLYELGYSIDLLCTPLSSVSYINDMSDYEFLNDVHIFNTQQNVAYEKLVSTSDNSKKDSLKQKLLPVLRKVYHKFSLYTSSAKIAKRLNPDILPNKEYDYVISVSDPKISQLGLKALIKNGLKAKKIIEYWGDPMTRDVTQKSIYPEFVIKREERKLLKIADKIVYTSPFTLGMEKNLHPMLANRMMFVPTANAFKKIYEDTNNSVYVVGYYGAYNSWIRNIMPLYNAFASLEGIAKLNLVGDSDLNLTEANNVLVRPRGVVKDFEKQTDLFICVLNNSGTQIPGKLYHNAATNRPILVILDGDQKESIKEYLSSFNRFYFCNNDEKDIVCSINKIIDENKCWEPCSLLDPKRIAGMIIE